MRLTEAERRRVYLAQQRAQQTILTRISEAPVETISPAASSRGPGRLLKTAAIVVLLGGVLLVTRMVEFHLPASLVEALLPRL